VRRQLMSFLTGEIDPHRRLLMESHIASCSSCSEEMDQMERVWGMLGVWEVPSSPSRQFEEVFWKKNSAAWDRIQDQPQKVSWFKWGTLWAPVAMAGAVLIAFSLFMFLRTKPVPYQQSWNINPNLLDRVDPDQIEIILSSFEEVK